MIVSDCLTGHPDWLLDYSISSTVRANHCIPLSDMSPFCFEVTIDQKGAQGWVGVGFCEEYVSLGEFVGWQDGTWGYHGEEAFLRADGIDIDDNIPASFSGDVVGCGIDLRNGTAFFTRNGTRIGESSTPVIV